MTALADIQGLIWDLDGTLYRFDDVFKMACNRAAAKAACQLDPALLYEDALANCIQSEIDHGFSLYWFPHDGPQSYQAMHFAYHDAIEVGVIRRNEEMAQTLRALTIPSVLLTNASRGWADRALKHLGMGDIFGDGKILGLEDVGFAAKSKTSAGFEKAIALLDLPADNILLVEDQERNLPHAKSLGLKTALVHHGLLPEQESLADFRFADTLGLLQELKSGNYSAASSASASKR